MLVISTRTLSQWRHLIRDLSGPAVHCKRVNHAECGTTTHLGLIWVLFVVEREPSEPENKVSAVRARAQVMTLGHEKDKIRTRLLEEGFMSSSGVLLVPVRWK